MLGELVAAHMVFVVGTCIGRESGLLMIIEGVDVVLVVMGGMQREDYIYTA